MRLTYRRRVAVPARRYSRYYSEKVIVAVTTPFEDISGHGRRSTGTERVRMSRCYLLVVKRSSSIGAKK
jgi:hypothetical protein